MKKVAIALSLSTFFAFGGGDVAKVATPSEEIKTPSSWSYEFEPYIIFTKITGDVSLGRINNVSLDVPFSTIRENLQMGAMAKFEAHHSSGWGFMVDYAFMDLAKEHTGRLGGVTEAGVRQGILELYALYRDDLAQNTTIDYMVGARSWQNDFELSHSILPNITLQRSVHWIDAFVGARVNYKMTQNWTIQAIGTIGGAELSSHFTASAAAGIKYSLSDAIELDFQYKALWVDYEEGTQGTHDYYAYDTTSKGPIVGVNFKW